MMRMRDSTKKIIELLRKRGFSSSIRLGIMIYLLAKKKVFFMDMVSDLNITPGNLWSHLIKLQEEGYVEIKYVLSGRPRRLVVLTNKGADEILGLLNEITKILNLLGVNET